MTEESSEAGAGTSPEAEYARRLAEVEAIRAAGEIGRASCRERV